MRNVIFLVSIIAFHTVGAWAFVHSMKVTPPRAYPEALMTVFIQPTLTRAGSGSDRPDMSRVSFRLDTPTQQLHVDIPRIEFDVSRNASAISAAPSIEPYPVIDMGPFVRSAALLQGEGATVVLRIEVLGDGLPGQIAVEVSSGSAQVDEAAIAFARAHRWVPAMLAGAPHAMWIRWGVRLQA
jgi:TonB family protein